MTQYEQDITAYYEKSHGIPCGVCWEKWAVPGMKCKNCGCEWWWMEKMYKTPKKEMALRYNSKKPQYSLIDMQALLPLVAVLEFWAKKYARNNWKKDMDMDQLMDSLLRHVAALQWEPYDRESGIHHIWHILANAMFYSYHLKRLWVPLSNSQKSPDSVWSDKSTDHKPLDCPSKFGSEPHFVWHSSLTRMVLDPHGTEESLSQIQEWGQSNTQNAPGKSGHNFTTKPLRSTESEKSSIT